MAQGDESRNKPVNYVVNLDSIQVTTLDGSETPGPFWISDKSSESMAKLMNRRTDWMNDELTPRGDDVGYADLPPTRDGVHALFQRIHELGGVPDRVQFDPVLVMGLAVKLLADETREDREALQMVVDGVIPLSSFAQACFDAMVEDVA